MTFPRLGLPRSTAALLARRKRPTFGTKSSGGYVRYSSAPGTTDIDALLAQQRDSTEATVRGYEVLQNTVGYVPGGIPTVGGVQTGYQLAPPVFDFGAPTPREPSIGIGPTSTYQSEAERAARANAASTARYQAQADYYAARGYDTGDPTDATFNSAMDILSAQIAAAQLQRDQAISQGLRDVADQYDTRIADLTKQLGKVREAKTEVSSAFDRYRTAVNPFFESATSQSVVDTAQLQAIGDAAAAAVAQTYEAGSEELNALLSEVAGESPGLAEELQADFSEWEGLITESIRTGTADAQAVLSATDQFSKALAGKITADDRLAKGADETSLAIELQSRAQSIIDEVEAQLAARDKALASAEAQLRQQYGDIPGITPEMTWEFAWNKFALEKGWNFEQVDQELRIFNDLRQEGVTNREEARQYITASVRDANLGSLSSIFGADLIEAARNGGFLPDGVLLPPGNAGTNNNYAIQIAGLLAEASRALGLEGDAASLMPQAMQYAAGRETLADWSDTLDLFDLWATNVDRWTGDNARYTMTWGSGGQGYYAMSNAERRAHPAYQERARYVTTVASQLASLFPGTSYGQDRPLDQYANETGKGRLDGRRSTRSDHYWGGALDISGSTASITRAVNYLNANQAQYGIAYILWQTSGHYDHAHISFLPPAAVTPTDTAQGDGGGGGGTAGGGPIAV